MYADHLSYIKKYAIDQLESLISVTIESKRTVEIEPGTFDGMKNLSSVNLQVNLTA